MNRFGVLFAASLLLTGSALAADLSWNSSTSPMYSPTPVTGWSGFYAGVNAGYGWGNVNRETSAGASIDNNTGGGVFGAQAGYNMDLGGFVVGAEADLQWSGIGYSDDLGGGSTLKASTDVFGTIRGRAGVGLGKVMPYVTGGFAAGRGSVSTTDNQNVVTSQSNTHTGWTVGAGLEAQATDNVSIKAEYLYVDLGTQTYSGLPGGNINASQRFGVVRAGLNYKF
jgi:outer membrane immunogenic protein